MLFCFMWVIVSDIEVELQVWLPSKRKKSYNSEAYQLQQHLELPGLEN